MSANAITWVGLDAHKESIKVAALFPDRPEPVEWTEATTPEAIQRLARKLQRHAPGEVRACYEAGPTGYALHRLLEGAGVICEVVAPSLTPVKPGSRIKTDRRDARKLAELLRAGLLTEPQLLEPRQVPAAPVILRVPVDAVAPQQELAQPVTGPQPSPSLEPNYGTAAASAKRQPP